MKDKDLRLLGEKLKETREAKKLTLEKIAEQTKININFLRSIEEGKFDFLPELYVRNFLKGYLSELGETAFIYLREYDNIIRRQETPADTITDEELKNFSADPVLHQESGFKFEKIMPFFKQKNVYWYGSGIIIVIIIIYSLVNTGNNQQIVNGSTGTVVLQESTKNSLDTSLFVKNLFSAPKKLHLELQAIQKTWLQVAIDDSAAKEFIFDKGENYNWVAKDKYLLRIGNGAGIQLTLNGQNLGVLGDEGEVVKLVLTKDGIQNETF